MGSCGLGFLPKKRLMHLTSPHLFQHPHPTAPTPRALKGAIAHGGAVWWLSAAPLLRASWSLRSWPAPLRAAATSRILLDLGGSDGVSSASNGCTTPHGVVVLSWVLCHK